MQELYRGEKLSVKSTFFHACYIGINCGIQKRTGDSGEYSKTFRNRGGEKLIFQNLVGRDRKLLFLSFFSITIQKKKFINGNIPLSPPIKRIFSKHIEVLAFLLIQATLKRTFKPSFDMLMLTIQLQMKVSRFVAF